jgi:hypothetical protein
MAAPRSSYSRSYDQRRDNTGAMIGLGIGLFALGAIIAAQNRSQAYYEPRYEPRYVPPPPRQRYGYDRYGYDRYDNDGYYGR